jgi:molybdenum cofactor biosynthesis enzyme
MATKRTSDLIPLCHPLALTHAEVRFEELCEASSGRLRVLCTTEVVGPTGVEMEALVGASVAALTVYDMLKSVDRAMTLGPTRLLEKTGGQSEPFDADDKTEVRGTPRSATGEQPGAGATSSDGDSGAPKGDRSDAP